MSTTCINALRTASGKICATASHYCILLYDLGSSIHSVRAEQLVHEVLECGWGPENTEGKSGKVVYPKAVEKTIFLQDIGVKEISQYPDIPISLSYSKSSVK